MEYIIWAAARSPHVTAVIIWVLIQLHLVDGRELAFLCAALTAAPGSSPPASAVMVDDKEGNPAVNEEGQEVIGDGQGNGQENNH